MEIWYALTFTFYTKPQKLAAAVTFSHLCCVHLREFSSRSVGEDLNTLQLSIDGTTWTGYKELGGHVKV